MASTSPREECAERRRPGSASSWKNSSPNPSPLQKSSSATTVGSEKKRSSSEKVLVMCNNCKPTSRDKTTMSSSVVPMADGVSKQYSLSMPSPNAILKSILASAARRSPKLLPDVSSSSPCSTVKDQKERWKIVVAELSHKLVHASGGRSSDVSS